MSNFNPLRLTWRAHGSPNGNPFSFPFMDNNTVVVNPSQVYNDGYITSADNIIHKTVSVSSTTMTLVLQMGESPSNPRDLPYAAFVVFKPEADMTLVWNCLHTPSSTAARTNAVRLRSGWPFILSGNEVANVSGMATIEARMVEEVVESDIANGTVWSFYAYHTTAGAQKLHMWGVSEWE